MFLQNVFSGKNFSIVQKRGSFYNKKRCGVASIENPRYFSAFVYFFSSSSFLEFFFWFWRALQTFCWHPLTFILEHNNGGLEAEKSGNEYNEEMFRLGKIQNNISAIYF